MLKVGDVVKHRTVTLFDTRVNKSTTPLSGIVTIVNERNECRVRAIDAILNSLLLETDS